MGARLEMVTSDRLRADRKPPPVGLKWQRLEEVQVVFMTEPPSTHRARYPNGRFRRLAVR